MIASVAGENRYGDVIWMVLVEPPLQPVPFDTVGFGVEPAAWLGGGADVRGGAVVAATVDADGDVVAVGG